RNIGFHHTTTLRQHVLNALTFFRHAALDLTQTGFSGRFLRMKGHAHGIRHIDEKARVVPVLFGGTLSTSAATRVTEFHNRDISPHRDVADNPLLLRFSPSRSRRRRWGYRSHRPVAWLCACPPRHGQRTLDPTVRSGPRL